VNPDLLRLHPYPFERLRELFARAPVTSELAPISLSIGEPKHSTPEFITQSLRDSLAGLAHYPSTQGSPALRGAISTWLARRFSIAPPDPDSQVLPVTGTREALFAIAQTLVDRTREAPTVVCPNPFYQIYEGAALLAGARPLYANIDTNIDANIVAKRRFAVDYSAITEEQWAQVQLVYACSPANPTGRVMDLADWRDLFALSDRHGFVIAADECYSEIYCGPQAPLGALEAAQQLGRPDYERLICFGSLSKRSNVPGLRSGFVAGDRRLLRQFLLYRTYHGCAMSPPVQAASALAWADEAHVEANRVKYRRKFAEVTPLVQNVLETQLPDAAFYLWAKTPIDDELFAQQLHAAYNVAVLPGSYLGRSHGGSNPGCGFVRLALVAEPEECLEAARRIVQFTRSL
jgi:N-succinyldiaminopimelate aminotransferase